MPELPLVGVTAIIAGMAAFNRDAAIVESSLFRIGRASDQLEAQTAVSFGGAGSAFGAMATTVATGATLIAGGLLLAGGASIKFAADYQQQLAIVQAISGESKETIDQLGDSILDLSRTGTVGLKDLAEGATELARSGVTIPEVMGGALKAVQDLTIASGGEIGLSAAADLVANSMHSFGITVDEVDKITTAATVVAQNSTATFTGFGQAVAIAGPSFKAAGFTINDLAIAETILTRNGVTASTAATALRGVIQRLEVPSKAAAKVMEEYGIHLFDATGKGVGFRALLEQLNSAFGDEAVQSGKVTEEQRALALAQLGLQRTSVALFNLAIGGTEAFDELNESFGRLKASDLVAVVLQPMEAQLKIAVNNVLALSTAFGQGFLPALQSTTGPLVFFLTQIRTADARAFGKDIADAGVAIVQGIGQAITAFNQILIDIGLVAAGTEAFKTTLVALGVVVAGVLAPPLIAGIVALGEFLLVIAAVGTAVKIASGFLADGFRALSGWATQFGPLGTAAAEFFQAFSDNARAVSLLLSGDFVGAGKAASLGMGELGDAIRVNGGEALEFLGHKLDEAGAQFAPWASNAGAAGTVVSEALVGTHSAVEALSFLLQGNFKAASADAQAAMEHFGKALEPVVTFVRDELSKAFDYLVHTAWPAVQAAAKTVGDAFETLGTILHDTNEKAQASGAYDDLRHAWDQLVEGGGHLVDIAKELFDSISKLIQPFIDLAGAAEKAHGDVGPVADASDSLAISIKILAQGLNIAATTFNLVADAVSNTLHFFNEVIGVVIDVTGAILEMLGASGDLRDAWNNVQATAVVLSRAFSNIMAIISDLLGPVGEATQGFDLVKLAAELVGGAIGGPLALAIKGITLIIAAVTSIIKEAALQFTAFTGEVRTTQLQFEQFSVALGTALGTALQTLSTWGGQAIATITAFASQFLAGGAQLGASLVDGLRAGIAAGAAQIASAAASLVTNALQAARDAVGAHSPAQDFILLGDDMAEGVSIGLLRNVPKAKEAAKTYGDSILTEMASFVGDIETQSRTIGEKLDDIVTKVGQSIATTIDKANHDIQVTIDQTQEALNRLHGSEADPKSFESQEKAIQDLVNARKAAYQQQRQDEEAASKHTQDLAKADSDFKKAIAQSDLKLTQDIAKENASFIDALAAASTSKAKADLEVRHAQRLAALAQDHKDDLASLELRRKDNVDAINARFTDSQADIAKRRELDNAEREFNKAQDALITEFKQQQLIIERDTKIKTIEDAEDANVKKTQQSADDQRSLLLRSYTDRINDLKDKLLDKIPPLTGAAADQLEKFMENVQEQVDATTQEIVDAMGVTVTKSVDSVGDDATKILGRGGVVPTAAHDTTTAFNVTTDAADDLRGDPTSGFLGSKDAATQISFVLQQLDDKMPHLVKGILDLVDAINQLHDKTITITTVHKDVYQSSGSSGSKNSASTNSSPSSTLAEALANPGASGPGGSFDAARASAAQPEGAGRVLVMDHGGVVPGPYGAPVWAIVHGGEFIASMNSSLAQMARQFSSYQATPNMQSYQYQVNASYANTQSEASIAMDMRALVALSKGA